MYYMQVRMVLTGLTRASFTLALKRAFQTTLTHWVHATLGFQTTLADISFLSAARRTLALSFRILMASPPQAAQGVTSDTAALQHYLVDPSPHGFLANLITTANATIV